MKRWIVLILLVVGLDQLSKYAVLTHLAFGEHVPVTGFFDLVLVYNPGAAFSFLADQAGWQRWFFALLAVVVVVWLVALTWRHRREVRLPLAFSFIVGGAVGNLLDRLLHGAVVDFLYFHVQRYYWPAFNLADSAITLGVGLMLWAQFRHRPDGGAVAKQVRNSQ